MLKTKNARRIGLLLILIVVGSLYFRYQVLSIYGGDAGDLVSAIVTKGVPHPPGYPLYTLLGVILNTFVPWGTAAWRAGFLSSIPSVFALFFLFDLSFYLTRRFWVSLISTGVLAFTYPIFLYSITAEVFSLNNFFTVLLLWLFFHFWKEKKNKYFYLGAFTAGLSLTHHQIIIFLFPSLIFLILKSKAGLDKKNIGKGIALFFAGLTPYLYVLIAASFNPYLNWLGRPGFKNFLALITRETYGTFRAGAFISHDPFLRLLDVWSFFNFSYKDFRLIGMLFFLLGLIFLWKKERTVFLALVLAFVSYLFFIFYASFPLVENFMVGTFERFVMPLYILMTLFMAFGILNCQNLLEKLLAKMFDAKKRKQILFAVAILIAFYPLGLLYLNFPKLTILRNDFTAENLGDDLLTSIPPDSILLLAVDTPLFDSQYLYYTQKRWPQVKLAHFAKMLNPKMVYQFEMFYPEISLPKDGISVNAQFKSFVDKNYPRFPILSKHAYATEGGIWVPWGLVFRFYATKDLPDDAYILEENRKIWASSHDPLAGSLSKYKNLMLSDVLRMYGSAHQEFGFWAARRGFSEEAEKHLLEAERLYPADLDSFIILAQVYLQQKKCDQAEEQLQYRIAKDKDYAQSYLLMSLNYRLCRQDAEKAKTYEKLYEEKLGKKETPLKKL